MFSRFKISSDFNSIMDFFFPQSSINVDVHLFNLYFWLHSEIASNVQTLAGYKKKNNKPKYPNIGLWLTDSDLFLFHLSFSFCAFPNSWDRGLWCKKKNPHSSLKNTWHLSLRLHTRNLARRYLPGQNELYLQHSFTLSRQPEWGSKTCTHVETETEARAQTHTNTHTTRL